MRHVINAVKIMANTSAKAIILLLPDHAFPPTDPDMLELKDIVKHDVRFIIGTTGYNQITPNLARLPEIFEDIKHQIAAADTFRSRSNTIVRSLHFLSYQGLRETSNLPPKVAQQLLSNFTLESGTYLLKTEPPEHYPTLNIANILTDTEPSMNALGDKVVVFGYTVPRSAPFQTTEQSFANTSITGHALTNLTGISTTYLTANAIDNLLRGETLKTSPRWMMIAQAGIISGCTLLSLEFAGSTGALAVAILWATILILHALLYRWGNLYIPLADALLATIMVSLWSVSRRLKSNLNHLAEQKASTTMKSEFATFQTRFLSGFSSWLTSTTQVVTDLVRSSKQREGSSFNNNAIFDRIFISASDLNEYLIGMSQLVAIEQIERSQLKFEEFEIEGTLREIIRRFDIKSKTKEMDFSIAIDNGCEKIRSNKYLIDSILFNLISNAVKYATPSTTVQITISKNGDNSIILSVRDEGPGIAPELQERIFDQFYRINDDRSHGAKGSGVGLFLCKFFTESLGGRLEVISEKGRGSDFKVIIP